MRGNSLIPRAIYFGGEFMGVKPPKPVSIVISNNGGASGTINCIKFPALDVLDGSYFWFKSGTTLERYNNANALVWTLTISAVASSVLAGANAILGLCYANNNYYLLAYNSVTKGCKLFTLSSPATTSGVTAIGGGFTLINNPVDGDKLPEAHTIFLRSDGNLQLRVAYYTFLDIVINKTNGTLISQSVITQSGRPLTMLQALGLLYQSADQEIEVSGLTYGYTPNHINVFRGGKFATVPIDWAVAWRPSSTTIRLWGNYVLVATADDYPMLRYTAMERIDLDRWLHDICDAMEL